ncbi:hypothetical protein C8Q75DRAFT_779441 [Abortiporus biennis]|nr:hypothetical protein C8Q75DRAFT_779441 [Abortiporus biennis]
MIAAKRVKRKVENTVVSIRIERLVRHLQRARKERKTSDEMALASTLCVPKNANSLRTNCSIARHGRVGRGRE